MRFGFIGPGNMTQAIASQLQPVASELIPALRETTAVERGRSRTGERPGRCSTTSCCKSTT